MSIATIGKFRILGNGYKEKNKTKMEVFVVKNVKLL